MMPLVSPTAPSSTPCSCDSVGQALYTSVIYCYTPSSLFPVVRLPELLFRSCGFFSSLLAYLHNFGISSVSLSPPACIHVCSSVTPSVPGRLFFFKPQATKLFVTSTSKGMVVTTPPKI